MTKFVSAWHNGKAVLVNLAHVATLTAGEDMWVMTGANGQSHGMVTEAEILRVLGDFTADADKWTGRRIERATKPAS